MNRIELLRHTFEGLDSASAEKILKHAREITYPQGVVLCKEGAFESTFYILIDGEIEISKWLDFSQTERLLRVGRVGDFFGEMGIIHDVPRSASIRTARPTTVLEIDRVHFLDILKDNPDIALSLVRTTLNRMRANDQIQFEELRHNYEALQKLDQAKLDFIEVAAHELRTPLTVIQGYSKLLATSVPPNDTTEEVLGGLQEGINRMLHVVNAMLDLTRIDSQSLNVQAVPVLPKLIVNDALNTFDSALVKRGITIEEDHQPMPEIPFIYADPALMNKLFFQLVSNAIKYTPNNGTIEIRTREVHDSRIGHGVEIVVRDSGVGIRDENVAQIFEKFFQGGKPDQHSSSKTEFMGGGPGLGLAIAKGIVEAHNGVIWAESPGFDPDGMPGTEFHVLLPKGEPH